MDRRFPRAPGVTVAWMAMAVVLAGCKSVPEVPPGRKMGGERPNLPVSTTQVDAPGVGFSNAPPSSNGPAFTNGAPGSTTFRGTTAQSIGANPFDVEPSIPGSGTGTGTGERRAGYQVPGLDPGLGASGRPASMMSPGYR